MDDIQLRKLCLKTNLLYIEPDFHIHKRPIQKNAPRYLLFIRVYFSSEMRHYNLFHAFAIFKCPSVVKFWRNSKIFVIILVPLNEQFLYLESIHKIKPCFCRIFQSYWSIRFRVDSNLKHSDCALLKNITCVALLQRNIMYLLQNVFVCLLPLFDGFIPQGFSPYPWCWHC